MGFAYLGIGLGGAVVPWISHLLVRHFGWQVALRALGLLAILIALPAAFLAKDGPLTKENRAPARLAEPRAAVLTIPFFLLTLGSIVSIAPVSGTQRTRKIF